MTVTAQRSVVRVTSPLRSVRLTSIFGAVLLVGIALIPILLAKL